MRPPEIFDFLKRDVIGQEQALRFVSVAIFKHLQGEPFGNLMLIGNSGTGKTTIMRSMERLYQQHEEFSKYRVVIIMNANTFATDEGVIDTSRLFVRLEVPLEAARVVRVQRRLSLNLPSFYDLVVEVKGREVRLPIADRQLAFLNLPVTLRGELPAHLQPDVTLTTEYAGQKLVWQGKIVRTEAEIDVSSRMVQLVARVPNTDDETPLSVGLFVEAEIEGLSADNIVVLPRSALRNDNQVLIVDAEDKLRFRSIAPLRLYQDNVLVKDGLADGDRVCLSPIQTAIDGMTVNPIVEDA